MTLPEMKARHKGSCWKLTADELAEVHRTGRIWLGILGETMPPAIVTGTHPFEDT